MRCLASPCPASRESAGCPVALPTSPTGHTRPRLTRASTGALKALAPAHDVLWAGGADIHANSAREQQQGPPSVLPRARGTAERLNREDGPHLPAGCVGSRVSASGPDNDVGRTAPPVAPRSTRHSTGTDGLVDDDLVVTWAASESSRDGDPPRPVDTEVPVGASLLNLARFERLIDSRPL
jgi:hypothetical protein